MSPVRSCPTADLAADELAAVHDLLVTAFAGGEDGEFDAHDWDHTLGGSHVLVTDDDGAPVAHAAVVCRRVLHAGRTLRCGYVESVVVRADHRRRGLGSTLMIEVERLLAGYDLGALGATDDGLPLYAVRGWQVWRGPLAALTPDGVVATPDDAGAVMVLAETALGLDLDGDLTCDWRAGDLW